MNYAETTEYMFCQRPNFEKQGVNGYKAGLDGMRALDEHIGHPHRSFRSIHVAGTNGKGSVSHTLAAMLQASGYKKVGLYTSPHLADFNERIRVDGEPISHDYVVSFVGQHRPFFESVGATFFEIATAMAFDYFRHKGVEIAVVEVGLGGRLDSTNIIQPIISVITNISLDHTQLLGSTVEQIAREKAGIIKPGVPCIVGEAQPSVRGVFDDVAKQVGAEIIYAEDCAMLATAEERPAGGMHYRTKDGLALEGELSGAFQAKNANTILCALHVLREKGMLGKEAPERFEENIKTAFANVVSLTGLQGRWQTVRLHPRVVCDIGHNTGAWHYLSRQLSAVDCRQLRIVFGMLEDKDVTNVLAMLPRQARYYWTKGNTLRALPEDKMKSYGEQAGLTGDSYPSVEQAFRAATADAQPDDFIFVGGSNYIVAEFLKLGI